MIKTGLKKGIDSAISLGSIPEAEQKGGGRPSGRDTADQGLPRNQVVAYLALPGAAEHYVITAGAQLVQITGTGEARVVGVVTEPGETPFLCLIRTARLVLGVCPDGRLVDTASGFLLGCVVAVPPENAPSETHPGCPGRRPGEGKKSEP